MIMPDEITSQVNFFNTRLSPSIEVLPVKTKRDVMRHTGTAYFRKMLRIQYQQKSRLCFSIQDHRENDSGILPLSPGLRHKNRLSRKARLFLPSYNLSFVQINLNQSIDKI